MFSLKKWNHFFNISEKRMACFAKMVQSCKRQLEAINRDSGNISQGFMIGLLIRLHSSLHTTWSWLKGYFKILWMRQVVSMQFVCLSWFPTSTRTSKCRLYCSKQQDRDMSICLLDKEHKGQETYKKSPSFDYWFIWYPPLTLNWLSTGTGWALLHRLYN